MKKAIYSTGMMALALLCPITSAQEQPEPRELPRHVPRHVPLTEPRQVPEPEPSRLTPAERNKLRKAFGLSPSQRTEAQGAAKITKQKNPSARVTVPASNKGTAKQQPPKKAATPPKSTPPQ